MIPTPLVWLSTTLTLPILRLGVARPPARGTRAPSLSGSTVTMGKQARRDERME